MNKTTNTIAGVIAGVLLGAGGVSLTPADINDVKSAQDTYFSRTGDYFECHTYEGPQGKGYQVFYKTEEGEVSEGVGPESGERSYTRLNPIATSTDEVRTR